MWEDFGLREHHLNPLKTAHMSSDVTSIPSTWTVLIKMLVLAVAGPTPGLLNIDFHYNINLFNLP